MRSENEEIMALWAAIESIKERLDTLELSVGWIEDSEITDLDDNLPSLERRIERLEQEVL